MLKILLMILFSVFSANVFSTTDVVVMVCKKFNKQRVLYSLLYYKDLLVENYDYYEDQKKCKGDIRFSLRSEWNYSTSSGYQIFKKLNKSSLIIKSIVTDLNKNSSDCVATKSYPVSSDGCEFARLQKLKVGKTINLNNFLSHWD